MPLAPAMPTPLPKWAKWLIRTAEAVAWQIAQAVVTNDAKTTTVADFEWRYLAFVFNRPPIAGAVEDTAQFGLNLVNVTAGDLDKTWTSGDFTNVMTDVNEWWTAVKPIIGTGYTFKEVRFYRKQFNPTPTPASRFLATGPPVYIGTVGTNGTSANTALPQQVAASVTFKTPLARHWGRAYVPGLTSNRLDANQRWDGGTRTILANAFAELFDDLQGREFFPFVPITQVGGSLLSGGFGISDVQVDDIPDVIRRRRAKTTLGRTIGVPTA